MLLPIFFFASHIFSLEELYECTISETLCEEIISKAEITVTTDGRYCGCSGSPVDISVKSSIISNYCFYKNNQIKKITLNKVTNIYQHAFYGCQNLMEVDFGPSANTLATIDQGAFQCSAITTLNAISSLTKLTTIGEFSFCSIKIASTIKLPSNVQIIDHNAFQDSGAIFSFADLPSKLTTIGDYAFENTKFTGIFDDFQLKELTSIGCYAFNLKEIQNIKGKLNLPGSCNFAKNAFGVAHFTEIIINGGIVQSKSFEKVMVDHSIRITGVSNIDQDAFSSACFTSDEATFTIIDSTINSYGVRGFSFNGGGKLIIKDCTINPNSFERILGKPVVEFAHDDDKLNYDIGQEAFYHSEIVGPLVIPDFIDQVGKNAFSHCQYLNGSLILNATTVDDYSFSYSAFDGELTLGSNINSFRLINSRFHGFEGCKFNKLTIEPELAIRIPAGMFHQLRTIEGEVRFSEQISGIGEEAFFGCTGITSLVFDRNPQKSLEIGKSAFSGCSNIAGDIEIDRSVYYNTQTNQIIPEKAFYGCSSIHSIVLPNEITGISSGAFYGCSGLESINLPRSLTTLGSNAFYGCSNLNIDLVIPNQVKTIGDYAFYECTSLKSIAVGYSVTSIGKYAFCRCKFTGDIIIPLVTQIPEGAFLGCEGLDGILELYTGSNTATIGQSAFEGCRNLKGPLNIHSFTEINKRAFRGCSSLTGELNFNSNLRQINDYIFDGCSSLTGSITWPTSVSTIGEYAFNGCSGLSGDLNLPSSVIQVKQHAFHGCSGLTGPIVLTTTLRQVRRFAFAGCTGLSDSITVTVDGSGNPTIIERSAFSGCKGFKNGKLTFFINSDEENAIMSNQKISRYYKYGYFLRIENQAFEDCKFKNIYYNGRFQPDCDYDIGISKTKGIQTSTHYVNETFCSYPIHKDKLSGGAIAGIVIACIVVVAAIAVLVVFLILKKKKNNNNSESEIEMNNEP